MSKTDNNSKTPLEEKIDALVERGREIANALMTAVADDAHSDEDFSDELFCLQVAAQVILATAAFNFQLQNGIDGKDTLRRYTRSMEEEFDSLKEKEMEVLTFGDPPDKKGMH